MYHGLLLFMLVESLKIKLSSVSFDEVRNESFC
jgi:hypothetical protein